MLSYYFRVSITQHPFTSPFNKGEIRFKSDLPLQNMCPPGKNKFSGYRSAVRIGHPALPDIIERDRGITAIYNGNTTGSSIIDYCIKDDNIILENFFFK